MRHFQSFIAICAIVILVVANPAFSQDTTNAIEPTPHVYATVDSVELRAYVFRSDSTPLVDAPAIVIFHGGGWAMGEASWSFSRAEHFARCGMVAIAAQYRLSDQKSITPLEAMADARAIIRWIRANDSLLGIDPDRVAAYGTSAGAHIAACAAVFPDSTSAGIGSAPDALVLVSPALDLEKDTWSQQLLGTRATSASVSPAAHVRAGMPPTLILIGELDTVTPLAGAKKFSDQMRASGNRCELQVYPDVGHLFTPKGIPDNGWPQPDVAVRNEAYAKADEFLRSLGYIK